MDLFANLPQALRWLRNRQGRRQMEVAASARLTKAMLSAYETGKQAPTLESLGRLLVALGVDLHELQLALDLQQGPRVPPRDPTEEVREPHRAS